MLDKQIQPSFKLLVMDSGQQQLYCYENDFLLDIYAVSSAKNGLGELMGSECTPRGWHEVCEIYGLFHPKNSVFVARQWTGELYSEELKQAYPERDWILSRILRLKGLELGRNSGDLVDTYQRFIYLHGVPDDLPMGIPLSHGCIRMHNEEMIKLANWVTIGTKVCII